MGNFIRTSIFKFLINSSSMSFELLFVFSLQKTDYEIIGFLFLILLFWKLLELFH